MTPDTVFTLYDAVRGTPGGQAVDLSAIRRSDAILDLLASRRLMRPRAVHDPAIALLSAFAADVDSAPAPPASAASAAPAAPAAPAARGNWPAPAAGTWVRVAAAVAVAGAAATSGIMVTGMLARLARMGLSQPGRAAGGTGRAAVARRAAATRPRGTR